MAAIAVRLLDDAPAPIDWSELRVLVQLVGLSR